MVLSVNLIGTVQNQHKELKFDQKYTFWSIYQQLVSNIS